MGKPAIPKELELPCDEINKSNRKWLNEYKEETSHGVGYYQKIEKYFRFRAYKDMPFNTFTLSDVKKYIEVMEDNNYAKDTINNIPRILSSFKKFHIKHNPSLFRKDFLSDLPSRFVEEGDPSDAFSLTLTQIDLIREFNKKKILYELIFEIYFQLGIRKKDIFFCVPSNIDKNRSCFVTSPGKGIEYNAKIAELMGKLQEDQEIELTISKVNYYLEQVTDNLRNHKPSAYKKERLLNYSDLLKSHQKYIIKCPSCGDLTESVKQSWVLARIDKDSDFRLACSRCEGKNYD